MQPDLAKQIADKFIKRDDVDILTGIIWSNLALAVVPSAVNDGVFYISPNAGPSQLAGSACHENYFNVAWQNDNLHEAMGQYVSSNGFSNAYILAPNYPAGKDALAGFKRFYTGDLAGETYSQLGQTDYAAEIAAIREAEPDSVFFFLPGGMGIAFMKQYAQSGLDVPVFGPAFSFSQDILAAVGDAALGVKNTSQWSKDLDNPANAQFVAAFQDAYGRLPSLYASQGYDAARLIGSALAKASIDDADAFRAALEAAEFELGARRLQVRPQSPSDPGHLRPRGGQGGRRADQPRGRHRDGGSCRRLCGGMPDVTGSRARCGARSRPCP